MIPHNPTRKPGVAKEEDEDMEEKPSLKKEEEDDDDDDDAKGSKIEGEELQIRDVQYKLESLIPNDMIPSVPYPT